MGNPDRLSDWIANAIWDYNVCVIYGRNLGMIYLTYEFTLVGSLVLCFVILIYSWGFSSHDEEQC